MSLGIRDYDQTMAAWAGNRAIWYLAYGAYDQGTSMARVAWRYALRVW